MRRSPATQRTQAPLNPEDQATFRKWQRATLIFYGLFGVVLAVLAVGAAPVHPPIGASQQIARSTLASAGPQH